MSLAERLTSWMLIAVLAMVWSVPLSLVRAIAAEGDEPGRRIALVIGNADYASTDTLKNPVNDSRAIAESLTELGFDVTEVENADRKAFAKALGVFEKQAASAEAAVFYYSGHGFQLNGDNFLVPTDARLTSRQALAKETVLLDDIVKRVQGRNRQTLFFIDACRNNPLPENVRGKNAPDGLAQIEAGSGTFVAFATQPGNISRDGAGDHSPFTEALLDNMTTPGISISDMMIRVRNSVEEATAQTQTPWDQSSLRSQFYFAPEEEEDAALTDEDKDLLLSLDPALRTKFEQRFGIQIKEASVDDQEEPEAIIASIQPRFVISGIDAPETAEEDDAAGDVPSKPIGSLMIVSGDEDGDGSTGTDEVLPYGDDQGGTDIAALQPSDAEVAVPVPQSRPEPPAGDTAIATMTPDAVQPLEITKPSYDDGPYVPAPVTPVTARTAASAPEQNTVTVAALDADATSMARSTGLSVAPVMDDATVIRGEEVMPVDLAATGVEVSAPLAPTRKAEPVPLNMQPVPAPVVVQEDVAVSTPAVDAIGEIMAVTDKIGEVAAVKGEAGEVVAVTDTVERAVAGAPALAMVPIPSIPLGPKLTPAMSQAQSIVGEEKIELASVSPEEIEPPLIERAEPPLEEDQAETEPAPTEDQQRETARLIQGELTRLGCYRNSVDGQWGNNSARGLLRYYATKKESPDTLEPSDALLARLRTEDSVVCTRTETAKPKQKQENINRPDRPKIARAPRPDKPTVRRSEPKPRPMIARQPKVAQQGGGGAAPKARLSKNLKIGGLR